MKNKQYPLLKVYVVHQSAFLSIKEGNMMTDHKILGLYLDKDLAEEHKKNILIKKIAKSLGIADLKKAEERARQEYHFYVYDANRDPYISVTEHAVRGKQSKLLQLVNSDINNVGDFLIMLA